MNSASSASTSDCDSVASTGTTAHDLSLTDIAKDEALDEEDMNDDPTYVPLEVPLVPPCTEEPSIDPKSVVQDRLHPSDSNTPTETASEGNLGVEQPKPKKKGPKKKDHCTNCKRLERRNHRRREQTLKRAERQDDLRRSGCRSDGECAADGGGKADRCASFHKLRSALDAFKVDFGQLSNRFKLLYNDILSEIDTIEVEFQ